MRPNGRCVVGVLRMNVMNSAFGRTESRMYAALTVTDGLAPVLTSDDLAYERRQDELDELKAQLAEWES